MYTRNSNQKMLMLLTAIVAFVGLGIGFAAFTRSLTIDSEVTISPTDTFSSKVVFDTSDTTACTTSSANVTVNKGSVASNKITSASATLKAPGDYAICTYKIKNTSSYLAYLNKIVFSAKIACTAGSGTTASLVTAACAHVKATVQVGGTAFGTGGVSVTNTSATKGSNTAIANHTLAASTGTEYAYLKIYYDTDGNAATELADGSFTVAVSTITLTYNTTD